MGVKIVISDWDETITVKDTMRLVSQAAYQVKPGFEPQWKYFTEEYINDYNKFIKSRGDRVNLSQEEKYLSQLKEVELRSVARVETSNLFRGVPLDIVKAQAKLVEIRQGFWEALKIIRSLGIVFVVVSVNWSQAFIEQVFLDHGYNANDIKIYANEIETDSNGIGTGLLGGGHNLRTATDKLKLVKGLRTKFCRDNSFGRNDHGLEYDNKNYSTDGSLISDCDSKACEVMYLGDSSTDLLAILEADIGVVVVKEKLLREFERLGLYNKVKYIKSWDQLPDLLNSHVTIPKNENRQR